MRCWVPLAVLLLNAVSLRADSIEKELASFQGSWMVEVIEENGQREPESEAARFKISIHNRTMTVHQNGRDETMSFTIDPTQKPRAIDLVPNYGDDMGRTCKGIYEFYGDRLRICARPRGDRPKEFGSGDGILILLLRRSR